MPVPLSVDGNIYQRTNNSNTDIAFYNNLTNNGTINKDNLIMYFHGNNDQLGYHPTQLSMFFEAQFKDYAFFSPEYPGYGLTSYPRGYTPTQESILESMEGLIQGFVKDKLDGKYPKNIVVMGFSLGTAVLTYTIYKMNLPKHSKIRIIYFSPVTNLKDIVSDLLVWYKPIVKIFPSLVWDNWAIEKYADWIEENVDDVMIVHGDSDYLIDMKYGKKLHKLIKKSKIRILNGTGHTDIWTNQVLKEIIPEFIYKHKDIYKSYLRFKNKS